MDKFVPRNAAPRVEFRGIKNTCGRAIEVEGVAHVPQSIHKLVTGFYSPPPASEVLVGHNASGKQMAYYPEFDSNPQVREYWADYQRFGTVKCTGTLEEFFRRRKEQRE